MDAFFSKLYEFATWPATKQVDYVVYYLLAIEGATSVTAKAISETTTKLDLRQYKRLPQYLSESATSKNGKYVKVAGGGYRLERAEFDVIDKIVKNEPTKVSVSSQLTDLVAKVTNSNENRFLNEAINCYRVESYRAFIIMVWIVTMDHLQKHIFANFLAEFNAALAKSPDKKIKKIVNYDDFSDLPENKLIELARSSSVISNDVRKLLDEKLGTRNSAAHPSGIKISGHKATEFAIDVIDNVLLKYS